MQFKISSLWKTPMLCKFGKLWEARARRDTIFWSFCRRDFWLNGCVEVGPRVKGTITKITTFNRLFIIVLLLKSLTTMLISTEIELHGTGIFFKTLIAFQLTNWVSGFDCVIFKRPVYLGLEQNLHFFAS